jgi:hypothetical protein
MPNIIKIVLLGLCLGLWGCTETDVYSGSLAPNIANKISISGTVCTDDPAQRKFPVKIMFIVDTSGSMSENDPQQNRRYAVENVINRYINDPSGNYSFSVIKYAGDTFQLTEGYSRNEATLREAVALLGFINPCYGGNCRDWLSAMSLASSIFTGDVLTSNPGTRSRTRYVFVFVANGPPHLPISTDDDGCDEKCRLLRAVDELVDFGKEQGVAEVAFHAIQLDDVPGVCNGTAEMRYCNSTTPCPANCAGSEECLRPTRLCADNRSLACGDGDAFCDSLGLGTCSPEWYCTGDETVSSGCNGDDICAHQSAGRCEFLQVCNNDANRDCLANEDCCPTYACNDPNGAENQRASELLVSMSFAGRGAYHRFSIGAQLNLQVLDLSTSQSVFAKKAFLVTNSNTKLQNGVTMTDSDGDGMSDREEECYGEMLAKECRHLDRCECVLDVWSAENPLGSDTDPTLADTDNDGLSDMLEMYFATRNLDPLRVDLPQACYGLEYPYQGRDSDGDGLNDCEENLIGTDMSLFDTDRDGYPDQVEFKAGTNYLQEDHLIDKDMDGLDNGEELQMHLDPQTNDIKARSGDAYRYKVIDEGFRIVPFTSQPSHKLSGIEVTDVTGRTRAGASTLYFYPAGTTLHDGSQRQYPAMAWQDPHSSQSGLPVEIRGSGTYLLYSACSCVQDCASACAIGEWCDPTSGECVRDECDYIQCSSTERCDSYLAKCVADCTLSDCSLGERCDPLLGKCLTDRCMNLNCPGSQDCDAEAGVCSDIPCQGWSCPQGTRLDTTVKPPWLTVRINYDLLPLSGFWCDGSTDSNPCTTDADCTPGSFCRIRENITVGMANKNCISFKVKNISLVETLETVEGYGPGHNNIFVYFAQTPLDNPYAYSIFRAALVQIQYVDDKKIPDWAEVPLGDGDFLPILEK